MSHGESLEIVAKQFGFADWNTLSSQISEDQHGVLSCTFCGKSQRQVKKLIEAASPKGGDSGGVFICEECVELCTEVLSDESEGNTAKARRRGAKKPGS